MKKAISIILALVAAFFILKIAWWLLGIAFSIAMLVVQIVVIAAIAVPLYMIIQRKLLSR